MPTPFYHLSAAEELIQSPQLPAEIHHCLADERCSFLFGNTAPDVQVVSRQTREATHFFRIPIQNGDRPGWETLLSDYPALADPAGMTPEQTAFLAGYISHLQADWLWIKEIYAPIFGPEAEWETMSYRLYIHNVLRTYLDLQVLNTFSIPEGYCLETVNPTSWLPFVEDHFLVEWRDFIAGQLKPGAAARTVEVFAGRQDLEPETFYRLLESDEKMDREVFQYVSRGDLQSFRSRLIVENIELLKNYFKAE